MAAKGYPGDYKKGTRIDGLDDAAGIDGVEIFHAGTIAKDNAILANGGRVLNVCAMGKTVTWLYPRSTQGNPPNKCVRPSSVVTQTTVVSGACVCPNAGSSSRRPSCTEMTIRPRPSSASNALATRFVNTWHN